VLTGIAVGLYDTGMPSTVTGAVATIFFAVSNPIVAAGAGSARNGGRAPGAVGARVVGWILYGLTLASAIVSVGLGLMEISVPISLIVILGVSGVLSTLFMSLDAFITAAQAKALKEELKDVAKASGVRHAPYVGVAPSPSGKGVAIIGGWSAVF
jgi:hypothetical protein